MNRAFACLLLTLFAAAVTVLTAVNVNGQDARRLSSQSQRPPCPVMRDLATFDVGAIVVVRDPGDPNMFHVQRVDGYDDGETGEPIERHLDALMSLRRDDFVTVFGKVDGPIMLAHFDQAVGDGSWPMPVSLRMQPTRG